MNSERNNATAAQETETMTTFTTIAAYCHFCQCSLTLEDFRANGTNADLMALEDKLGAAVCLPCFTVKAVWYLESVSSPQTPEAAGEAMVEGKISDIRDGIRGSYCFATLTHALAAEMKTGRPRTAPTANPRKGVIVMIQKRLTVLSASEAARIEDERLDAKLAEIDAKLKAEGNDKHGEPGDFNFHPENGCQCDRDLALGCPANPGRVYGNDGTIGLCESGEASVWSPDGPLLHRPEETDTATTTETAPRLTDAERAQLWKNILQFDGKPGVGFIAREAYARIEEDDRRGMEEARREPAEALPFTNPTNPNQENETMTIKSDNLIREANIYTAAEITTAAESLSTFDKLDVRFAKVDARQHQIMRDMAVRRRAGQPFCPLLAAEFDGTQAEMQSLNLCMRQVDHAAYRIRCAQTDRQEGA